MSNEPLRKDDIQGQIIHVYDGIEEADNALPNWWLATFFGAIIFAVFYWMFYETFPVGDYPHEEYTTARAAAMESGGPVTDEDLITLSQDAPMVAAGKKTFDTTCMPCHGMQAQGTAGPNLTDEFWLYGGAPSEIYHTVFNGTSKGMPNWGAPLGGPATKQVVAYVLTLRNTNVAGREPQGEKWVAPAQGDAPVPDTKKEEPATP